MSGTYADQQGGDGRAVLIMDHGEQAGQVTLSGSRETQPAGRNIQQSVSSHTNAAPQHEGADGALRLTWRTWTGSRWCLRRWTEPRRSAWWRRTYPATSLRMSEQQNSRQTQWRVERWRTRRHQMFLPPSHSPQTPGYQFELVLKPRWWWGTWCQPLGGSLFIWWNMF